MRFMMPAGRLAARPPAFVLTGPVGVDGSLVTANQIFGDLALVGLDRGQDRPVGTNL